MRWWVAAVAQLREELTERSPTAIAIARQSSDADTEHIAALSTMGMRSLALYCDTGEAKEDVRFSSKARTPSFPRFRR